MRERRASSRGESAIAFVPARRSFVLGVDQQSDAADIVGDADAAIGSDISALGTMAGAYVPLRDMLERMSGPPPETPAPNSVPVDEHEDAEASRTPSPRKPTTRRSPAKLPARK